MKRKITKVLIFGLSGMLGREFTDLLSRDKKFSIFGYNSKNSDITNFEGIWAIINKIKPDIVINCAAKINVDACELDPLGTWMVNSVGPGNIARCLRLSKKKCTLLQISSSDVFSGQGEGTYKENAVASPVNVYGWSKLAGEKLVEQELINDKFVKYLIIRTGWLYGKFRNTFVENIVDSLKSNMPIRLVSDKYNIPTWTYDLVVAAMLLVNNNSKSGIYHLVSNGNKGAVSKYELAVYISHVLGLKHNQLKRCKHRDIFKTVRATRIILVNSKTEILPDWEESIMRYLK